MVEEKELGVKVIKGGTLIDGTGAQPIKDVTVVIEGQIIKAVGNGISVPKGAEVIDAKGKTVMPGLIDSHVHIWGGKANTQPMTRPAEVGLIKSIFDAKDLLAAGFTTAKDCGSRNALFLKKAVAEGTLTGLPRIVAAGFWVSQTYGHFDVHYLPVQYVDVRTSGLRTRVVDSLICDGVAECIKATRYALREGADFIKICTTGGGGSERDKPTDVQFNFDEIRAIVETAAQVGKFVTAHCELSLKAMKQSILAGVKTLDHACLTDDECVELAMKNGIVFVSTLSVFARLTGQEAEQRQPVKEGMERITEQMVESYKRIRNAGAPLATGTDTAGSRIKFGTNARELELLVSMCGFSPMDAIVAATKYGAMACFIGDKTGTIEPGKFADIIIIDGNPLANIKILQDLDKIKLVMLEGKVEIRRQ